MNKVILMGRLTKDPMFYPTTNENGSAIARYTLAVNRPFKANDGQQQADYISCVAFGKMAEVAQKYFKQGTKITISGRIQTGSYTKENGTKINTTEVVVEEQEFAESSK